MIRLSAGTENEQTRFGWASRDRPLPAKIAGWALLMGALLLILGGAYRAQANMINSGLLFLALGVAFVPGVLRMGWPMRVALGALVVIGAAYTFAT